MTDRQPLSPAITAMNYVLAVPDAMQTARFWIDVMKFDSLRDLGGWVFVKRGPCVIMLGSCPDAIAPRELGDHQYFGYIEFDDIDAYFDEIDQSKAAIIKPPTTEEWDMREFAVRTPDGHRVMFGQDLVAHPIS
ncbi:VOC family protein [Qipengyuania sp. ASV99]|uniref:VOC family protein n=1 Tax=Qipengyuania sp. ASV99 TaxID=3399681 RepID=UPI003A4C5B00